MTRDYEGAINLDQMPEEDVCELVRERLAEGEAFDADNVEVSVSEGRLVVDGRVGTEGERQYVDQVLSGLGAQDFDNNVVVDELRRGERSEAADLANVEDAAAQAPLGESARSTTDTADHRVEEESAELYGTQDMKKAIEEGDTYVPPSGPVQEGVRGDENH